MSVQMVRFRTRGPVVEEEIRTRIRHVCVALRAAEPAGITYVAYQVESEPESESEFVLLLELPDGSPNPLIDLPEATRLRELIGSSTGAPVPPVQLDVVGSYRS